MYFYTYIKLWFYEIFSVSLEAELKSRYVEVLRINMHDLASCHYSAVVSFPGVLPVCVSVHTYSEQTCILCIYRRHFHVHLLAVCGLNATSIYLLVLVYQTLTADVFGKDPVAMLKVSGGKAATSCAAH